MQPAHLLFDTIISAVKVMLLCMMARLVTIFTDEQAGVTLHDHEKNIKANFQTPYGKDVVEIDDKITLGLSCRGRGGRYHIINLSDLSLTSRSDL